MILKFVVPLPRILYTIVHIVDSIREFRRDGVEMFVSSRADLVFGGGGSLGNFVADLIFRGLLDIARGEREKDKDKSELLQSGSPLVP